MLKELIYKTNFWKNIEEFSYETGQITHFAYLTVKNMVKPPFEHQELVRQLYYVGNKSIPLIGLTAFIMGMVLTIQTRPVLVDFGAESLLPGMISVSIVREIGPVITALLCAGKISSGFGAEIGSMNVTEQIDAMSVSGTKPMKYVVASRVLATTIMVPLLVIMADVVGLAGTFFAVNIHSEVHLGLFIDQVFAALHFSDIVPSTIKTVFFGFFIGLIGCYKGYYCGRGTAAVGGAANSAVVTASVVIFIIDLVAVQVTDLFY